MLIFAHRGASADAPENTLAAVYEGLAQGSDGIEIDVRHSLDGKVFAIHDNNFQRTAGAKLTVGKTFSHKIKTLDAGSFKNKKFAGEKVPLLEEVLDAVPAGKLLQIELKGKKPAVAEVLEIIMKSGKSPAEITLISSSFNILKALKDRQENIKTAWIYAKKPIYRNNIPKISKLLAAFKENCIDALDFDCRLGIDKKYMDLLHKYGIKAYSWTVNDPARAAYFKEIGVSGIATDSPAFMRNALSKTDRSIL